MMSNLEHQEAQELSSRAELARLGGKPEVARALYAQAADLELAGLQRLPADKPRSRGILAVSYAALLFKAGLYDRAEQAICGLLAADFSPPYRDQLRELLQVTWEEQMLAQERMHYSGDEILVALRGGKIGVGTAPADMAARYLNAMNLIAFRAAELDAGLELRQHGPPAREIQAALQARATQPLGGSYRFSIRFVEPAQRSLFGEEETPDPTRVSRMVVQIFRALERNDPGALMQAIPREEYRLPLARLARNVVPTGDALSEVEIRTANETSAEAVYLRPDVRRNVNEAIRVLSPPPAEPESSQETIEGILRAVDLDRSWLHIVPDEGEPVRALTSPNELDDVIGPMVNRRVSARIQSESRRSRSGKTAMERRVIDIELLED
jgi:hypothetical protein